MTIKEIKELLKLLRQAEETILDISMEWMEEASEKDIDILHTGNAVCEIIEFVEDKLEEKSNA